MSRRGMYGELRGLWLHTDGDADADTGVGRVKWCRVVAG